MIIKQKVMRNVSLTAHPVGCKHYVQEQIEYLERQKRKADDNLIPKRILVIGGSTGYGLASRLVGSIIGNATTINVSFEREPTENKVATPGWYNTKAFEQEAAQRGLYAQSVFGDAFSDEVKEEVASLIEKNMGQVDLVIYSLASPMRIDPKTKETYKSVIKPIGEPYTALSVDVQTSIVQLATIDVADEKQVEETIKVMGGEDWFLWLNFLKEKNLLAKGVKTVAFSYIGPQITYPVYREGTIGKAKEHLEQTADQLNGLLKPLNGSAFVSVNKALVTRASAVIPVVPLYIALLYKVMKEMDLHEECIHQMYRLFTERLYSGQPIETDKKGRIRVDDWEMHENVQKEVLRRWKLQKEGEEIKEGDLEGFREEFDHIHGFGYDFIDYSLDVDPTKI